MAYKVDGDYLNHLIKRSERADELEAEIKSHAPEGRNYTNMQYFELSSEYVEACRVMESMKSEIEYALHSNKSDEVRQHYLENAVRYANRVLDGGMNNETE